MKRSCIIIAITALVLTALAIPWLVTPTHPITASNFARIDVGMTEQDVIGILGPPDNLIGEIQGQGDTEPVLMKCWSRPNRDTILVYYESRNGRLIVAEKACLFLTIWDRVHEWWGGYQNLPGGGRSKRLDAAA